MSNIVARELVAWIYFAKCYPRNLIQFPLDLYLYIGQTLRPDIRPEQHMTEDKNNWKFVLLRSLTCVDDWVFLFIPVIRKENESFENYMNRTGIIEKQAIRDCQTNYLRYGIDSCGLNATDGGEHPANGGYKGSVPGETTGVKYLSYRTDQNTYVYSKPIWCHDDQKFITKHFFKNQNPFLVYLYMESCGEEDFIVDENIFLDRVKKWWNDDIYNSQHGSHYLGIKNVSVRKKNSGTKRLDIIWQQKKEGKMISKASISFANFLQLYQDGILDIDDIYCLDFFVWNAKLILEGKFDIKNRRPDVFYADFFDFRKIHHFTVDNLKEPIEFLKVIEDLNDLSIPVGQQRLQFN